MVKKIKKYAKFIVCVALIMGLIAPSYAALSASDGSAFVTKAEFDSALADFNARLTTFEAGINSKIDSQVTSYLDRNGIWNGKEQNYPTGDLYWWGGITGTNNDDKHKPRDYAIAKKEITFTFNQTFTFDNWIGGVKLFNANKTGLLFIRLKDSVSPGNYGVARAHFGVIWNSHQGAWSSDNGVVGTANILTCNSSDSANLPVGTYFRSLASNNTNGVDIVNGKVKFDDMSSVASTIWGVSNIAPLQMAVNTWVQDQTKTNYVNVASVTYGGESEYTLLGFVSKGSDVYLGYKIKLWGFISDSKCYPGETGVTLYLQKEPANTIYHNSGRNPIVNVVTAKIY